jgi:hypothetical protein
MRITNKTERELFQEWLDKHESFWSKNGLYSTLDLVEVWCARATLDKPTLPNCRCTIKPITEISTVGIVQRNNKEKENKEIFYSILFGLGISLLIACEFILLNISPV